MAALALPPVVGWMDSKKGVSVVLGEVAAPCEKGKGKVGKKWGWGLVPTGTASSCKGVSYLFASGVLN